jgi:TetR/AcrR family transcriptional repressor of nem operon
MGRPSDAKERLIEAAITIIFANSYGNVSVDELCLQAGVTKSSFYHFFTSKRDLVLAALEDYWQSFEQTILTRTFNKRLPPQEQILYFFDLTMEKQLQRLATSGSIRGCPIGNMTLEMSTQDSLIRERVEQIFQRWLTYFERMLNEAKEQGLVPITLDTTITAQALLAYFEGVMLLAKGRNDPALFHMLRSGTLALMQYQEQPVL